MVIIKVFKTHMYMSIREKFFRGLYDVFSCSKILSFPQALAYNLLSRGGGGGVGSQCL